MEVTLFKMKTEFQTQIPGKRFPINNIEFQKLMINDLNNKWFADQTPRGIIGIFFVEKNTEVEYFSFTDEIDAPIIASFNISVEPNRLIKICLQSIRGYFNEGNTFYSTEHPKNLFIQLNGERPTASSSLTYRTTTIPTPESRRSGSFVAHITEWLTIASGGDYQLDVGIDPSEYGGNFYASEREPLIVVVRDVGSIAGKVINI